MLFDSAIHFKDEKTLHVDVYTRNKRKICSGELSLEKNSLPRLELPFTFDRKKLSKNTFFQCKHKDQWFTLIDCTIATSYIYPKIVANTRRRDGRFKQIGIAFQGLSDWMDKSEYIDSNVDENVITKSVNQDNFNVTITDPAKGRIAISSRTPWETSHLPNNCFQVRQYRVISMKMLDDSLSPDELIDKIYEIMNVFSLLVGHSVNIEYVFDEQQKRHSNSIYFCSFYDDNQPKIEKHRCIADSNYLFRNNKWEVIFKKYYESEYKNHKTIWSRLAGTLNKQRNWEYELLSRVSLIDSYSTILSKNDNQKLPRASYKALKEKISEVINEHTNNFDCSESDQAVLAVIKKQFDNNVRNQLLHSFKERLHYSMEFHNSDVVKAINLSKDQINDLIILRNHIAHGKVPITKKKNNITHEAILVNKALLLLLYWAYRDLGLNDHDIAHFFNDSFNPTIMNALVNKQILDELTRDYPCIPVTKADFLKLSKQPHLQNVFEYKKGRKNYIYHPELTEKVKRDWILNRPKTNTRKFRYLELFLGSIVNPAHIHTITYVGNAYIQNQGNKLKVSSLCLLNPPNTINPAFARCWSFDKKNRSWKRNDMVEP